MLEVVPLRVSMKKGVKCLVIYFSQSILSKIAYTLIIILTTWRYNVKENCIYVSAVVLNIYMI